MDCSSTRSQNVSEISHSSLRTNLTSSNLRQALRPYVNPVHGEISFARLKGGNENLTSGQNDVNANPVFHTLSDQMIAFIEIRRLAERKLKILICRVSINN